MNAQQINWNSGFNIKLPNSIELALNNFDCVVIDGKGSDNIFQFFKVKRKDFNDIVAEVIEDYFGTTNGFAIEYVRELSMYGLLAKDQRDTPLYNREFHVDSFLKLLDATMSELST